MTTPLVIGPSNTASTPLMIFSPSNFAIWIKEQPVLTQNWVSQHHIDKQGHCLIPNSEGQIHLAVFVTEQADSFWACGELVNQLPHGQYAIQGNQDQIEKAALSWGLGGYRFERYKKSNKPLPQLVVPSEEIASKANRFIRATSLTRDLINTPAGDMMPQDLAHTLSQMAGEFGGQLSQIIGDDLLEQNYPTIHMVGRASVHAPRLLDFTWGDNNAPQVTLVGKGVCFDSGGLDLKPGAGMRLMKKDMGGAAHVIGLAQLIMAHELPIRLRVLVPAVENAVSANAFRPGDVITTRHGISVEIDNTDAEGRLVLCDALSEANHDKPDMIIDFATLTGAMRVALGTELPGFFSNDDMLANGITQSGLQHEDPVWRMPLHQAYQDLLKSEVADLSNCATSPFGGAITAALYLQAFVDKDITWAHFDVMAWNNRKLPGRPIGGEAFGIRAVFDYLQQKYA
ncbi:M17 family metallopeptidase [uncultured Shewanella sp.]|uniref:leucyl aminopeptidase family protein n=1 Tax=uncultured Shewanella sp. TaxID=173975 RepID=UPI002623E8E3|nr:leucyl aminopeptidase family protein [uncultured Shewanella sp.]